MIAASALDTDARAPAASAPVSDTAKPAEATKSAFPEVSASPTQSADHDIRFDFNQGARVLLPARSDGVWRVVLRDLDTGNVLFESENQGATIRSTKRWFVRFGLEIWSVDPGGDPMPVLKHDYDNIGRHVMIQFPVGTLGDIMAWFPYAARFKQKFPGCHLTFAMSELIIPLFRDAYPDIDFVTHAEFAERKLAESAYATYSLGCFFDDTACEFQPTDFRHVGLHKTAAYILGVDPAEEAPRLVVDDDTRPIEDPYVCIAVQSSTQAKYWNNPHGWRAVVAYLKSIGYRVVCIDQKAVHGHGMVWNHIPHGVEDETGDRPLVERARWLRHAAAFVGLSSGLAWLAWAAGTSVVMISGFTHPTNEFETPYRVVNWHTCNSCWNDVQVRFNHTDFMWCPRHAGTDRQFECTRLITPDQVIGVLKRVTTLTPIQHAA